LSEVMEVFVFGVPEDKYVFHRGVRIRYNVGSGERISQHMVEIFNEKAGRWQKYAVNEAFVECPVCGKRLKAYYIPGTTWLACCSEECYGKLDEKAKELGDFWKALEYFQERKTKAGLFGSNPKLSSFREKNRLKIERGEGYES